MEDRYRITDIVGALTQNGIRLRALLQARSSGQLLENRMILVSVPDLTLCETARPFSIFSDIVPGSVQPV